MYSFYRNGTVSPCLQGFRKKIYDAYFFTAELSVWVFYMMEN